MLKREKYLSRIRPYYESDLIKSIAGIRRCGKSTILSQIKEELSECVSADQLIFYDFEDFDNYHYLKDPEGFYMDVKARIGALGGRRPYVFIDEVQYMERYIPVIASIRSALGASVFVTGSTSTLISGELAKRLTGRYAEFAVFPFSYDEMVQFIGRDDDEALSDYLRWGGFPIRFAHSLNARTSIQDILSSIVDRDILSRHPELDRWNFRNFLSYILAYTSNVISTESLSAFISINEKKLSPTTCYAYLEAMREANLISMPQRFDIKGKEMLKTLRARGYKVGVLTRGCREYAETALRIAGVDGCLDCLVARDDYPEEEAKPSPIAMEHTAGLLGLTPDRVLFLGDHKFDYQCAESSGAGFIGVLSGAYREEDWRELSEDIMLLPTVSQLVDLI